ncbi:MAG: polysaccharide deacetylase family protein [Ferruginibacter sp.]
MDPDSGSYFSSATLFKTSLLTISFSTIYFYQPDQSFTFFKQPVIKEDTIAAVVLKPVPARKKKTIYLSFDDGPNKGTKKVMAILQAEKIPATLFIIGEHVYGSREQRNIYDSLVNCSLFQIANHSYTHAFENNYRTFYEAEDSAVGDFKRCADSLHLNSNIVRLPGRNMWRTRNLSSTDIKSTGATADSLYKNGFDVIGWDLEWHFTNNQRLVQSDSVLLHQVDSVFANNRTKTVDQLVLLAHDRTFLSAADSSSLHRFIILLKSRDEYNFETISKYPGVANN